MEKSKSVLNRVLSFISENPGCTRKELKKALGISHGWYVDGFYGYTVGNGGYWGLRHPEYIEIKHSPRSKTLKKAYVNTFYITDLGRSRLNGELFSKKDKNKKVITQEITFNSNHKFEI